MSKKKFFTRQAVKEGLTKEESKELYLLAVDTNSNLNAKEAIQKHLPGEEVVEEVQVVEVTPVAEESVEEPVVVKKSKTSKK
jgi:hypothetical protein